MRFIALTDRNMKEVFRDPLSSLLGMAMPIALLILFSTLYKSTHMESFSPRVLTSGIVVFSYAFLIMFSANLLAKDKQTSFLTRLFTTPLKPIDFILSYFIPYIPLAILQTIVCLITGTILGSTFDNLLQSSVVFFLISMICISLGMLIGSLLTMNQVAGVGSILITFISIFGGAWMDLNQIGGVFKAIGYAMPFAHATDALKAILSGSSLMDVSHNLIVLLIYFTVIFLLAIISFSRVMKKH